MCDQVGTSFAPRSLMATLFMKKKRSFLGNYQEIKRRATSLRTIWRKFRAEISHGDPFREKSVLLVEILRLFLRITEKQKDAQRRCEQFGGSFAPRSLMATLFVKKTFSKKRPTKSQHFSKKSTSYAPPAQSTRTKMTADGFSSYELFVKIDTF